jgi:hypothetical protein
MVIHLHAHPALFATAMTAGDSPIAIAIALPGYAGTMMDSAG